MDLIKPHLINAIAKQNAFTCKKSTDTVEALLGIIKSTLTSGDDVLINDSGAEGGCDI